MILYKKNKKFIPKNEINFIHKLRKYDNNTKREIENSLIIKNISNWNQYFSPIYEEIQTTLQEIDDIYIYQNEKINNKYILLKYRINSEYKELFDYLNFIFNCLGNSVVNINNIRKIVFSFYYLLENIKLLQENKIYFVGFSQENIRINNNNHCIIVNFQNSITKIESYDFCNFIDNLYLFYPIEFHFLKYIIDNNIISPTIETIEIVWNDWLFHMREDKFIHYFFTDNLISLKKEQFFNNFYCLINKKIEDIYKYINQYINYWNTYGLSILYLYILFYLDKNEIIKKIIDLLVDNIINYKKYNDFIDLYNNIIYSLREEDWKFYFSDTDNIKKYKLIF